MYPFIRTAKQLWINRDPGQLDIGTDHVTPLIVWPWDMDIFLELNNGRVLTLFDLGRILRPKADGGDAVFYSLVTADSVEQDYAAKRQLFLTEQGYRYEIVAHEPADGSGGTGGEDDAS